MKNRYDVECELVLQILGQVDNLWWVEWHPLWWGEETVGGWGRDNDIPNAEHIQIDIRHHQEIN